MSVTASHMFTALSELQPMQALLAAAVGFAFWLVLRMLHISERRWKLRMKKHKPFRQLLKNDGWRKVARFDFHAAMTDAFGRSIEPAEFAFMQTRARPLVLLQDRFAAGIFIRFSVDALRYEWFGKRRASPNALAVASLAAGLVGSMLVSTAIAMALLFLQTPSLGFVALFVIATMSGVLMLVVDAGLHAASRLLRLDDLHPEAKPIPRSLAARSRLVPSPRKPSKADEPPQP